MNKKVMEEKIRELNGGYKEREVSLNDSISVGCNNCGKCCKNVEVRLTSYDLYRIAQKTSMEECSKNIEMYFGDSSGLPCVMIRNTGKCPYLKLNRDGNYSCKIEDAKPVTCSNPFIAIAKKFDEKDFSFVPLDQEVEKLNVKEILERISIKNSSIFFIEERNNLCESDNKKNVLVSEYLKDRIDIDDNYNISNIVTLMLNRYIEPSRFFRLLHLSENSSCNNMLQLVPDSSFQKITKKIFLECYFYTNTESKESFMEQTLKHIKLLESQSLPLYRMLYKHLTKLYNINDVFYKNILDIDDMKLAQERFDNYFNEHVNEIKENFRLMIPELMSDITKLEKECKTDDD